MKAYSYTNSKGQDYYLHGRQVKLKNDRLQMIYFFARDIRESDALEQVPAGYTVVESPRTSMPLLKKQ